MADESTKKNISIENQNDTDDENNYTEENSTERLRGLNIQETNYLLRQLKRHEGRVTNRKGEHVPYQCPAGARTIGYGHNLDSKPLPGDDKKEYSLLEIQAESLLFDDVINHEIEMREAFPWSRELNGPRYAAFLNFCFNCGIPTAKKFKESLGYLKDKKYKEAGECLKKSKWAGQVGSRSKEIIKQIITGRWPHE